MIVDRIDNWSRWVSGPAWQCAFEFIQGLDPEADEKTYELDGTNVFAPVMSYQTRGPEEAVLEAHRKYIDIQVALAGSETLEWFPVADLEVQTPYDADRDVEFYHRPHAGPASVVLRPGLFVILFPQDAHMPQLTTGSMPSHVKKVVGKIRLGAVEARMGPTGRAN
jgi:YhcH/YjgK/YiaL family protein